ncbi:MAG: YbfB/YjiJ family MFS transporter [Methylobacteriaceae bacterium]|nr:YbfB/YjiJ family MFS transporter [Methylobacteriaceae bacterium]
MNSRQSGARAAPFKIAAAGGALMGAAMGIGRFVYTPLLPHMQEALHLTPAIAGWIASANYLGYLAGALMTTFVAPPNAPRRVIAFGVILSAITTALMAAGPPVALFATFTFLGGLASALVLVYTTPIVFLRLAEMGAERYISLLFGGVGAGMAVSALLVSALAAAGFDWRVQWLASGAITALALFALLHIPDIERQRTFGGSDKLAWPRGLPALLASYTLFGFGYVITATFIVVIVRENASLRPLEPVIWTIVGLAGIPSVWAWTVLAGRIGLFAAYALACLTEAIGVAASVIATSIPVVILAAILLGGTFMAITSLGLAGARRMASSDPVRVLALLTAGFGVGQIIGPSLAGYLRESMGTYLVPSLVAAAALVIAAALSAPLNRGQ